MTSATWSLFFQENPYDDFEASKYSGDLQGWGSNHPIFDTLISAVRPSLIVEVGSWKGASAIHMATVCKLKGINLSIICIDTWLGTIESYTWKETEPNLYLDLAFKNGWPQLYYQFLSNVVKYGFEKTIVPLPQTSHIGLRMIYDLNLRPELIYLDASHDYLDVKKDIELAWNCIKDDGIIFGDDYLNWSSVTQAVDEFCIENKLILMGGVGKFAICKNGNIYEFLGERKLINPDGSCGGLKICRPVVTCPRDFGPRTT
jgi:hypothetical protein